MTLLRWHRPEVARWSPFHQLSTLRNEIDRLFEAPLSGLNAGTTPFFGTWSPALDMFEDKDHLIVKAELPGMKKDDLGIELHDGVLTISGERKQEHSSENAEVHRSERFVGRFQRSVTLPVLVSADAVKASYRDGILTVTLPKVEEAKPKQIQVKAE